MKLFILCLQLIGTLQGLSGSRHETLCTSNTCYTSHMEKATFNKANQNCINNGGQLMTIRSKHEEDMLRSLLSKIQEKSHGKLAAFWIGLKLQKKDCVVHGKPLRGFKWVSGEDESTYSNWKDNPPLTCTTESCVKINHTFSDQNQLKWTAAGCRSRAFYACKFYFQGMCQPLALQGPGHISYTAPFSDIPQIGKMDLLPKGTYSKITCSDQQSHYSVCTEVDGTFRWTNPGPFCKSEKQSCEINNGGCEHICSLDGDSVRCSCKDGYNLDDDAFSCRIRDLCGPDTCEHECVMGVSGFFCKCPDGFHLDANQRTCSDIDECQLETCEGHECINTPGGYECVCRDGYEMLSGECRDIDECTSSTCEHRCLNHAGSFSCSCNDGFALSSDGRSCVDVDECMDDLCPIKFTCINTIGSFQCARHQENRETTAAPPMSAEGSADEESHENATQSLITVELQHESPHVNVAPPVVINVTDANQRINASTSEAKTVKSRVLICILGSVVPLLVLVAVTLFIVVYRCSRSKKEVKKNASADGYCWVSSGLDPRLEKLYESIMTDDL